MQILYRKRADHLKAMGHPLRLQILDILRREPECVCHLSAALHKPQPYVSQQLAILRNAGVIVDEREGTNVYYRLAGADVAGMVDAVLDATSLDRTVGRRAVEGCSCPKCGQPRSDELRRDAAEPAGTLVGASVGRRAT